jgi:hypothetical protein
MKFPERPSAHLPERDALATRLSAIAARGRLEVADETPVPNAPVHVGIERRFWTPDELPEIADE